jgi:DNA-binding transcriptional MerR regulator
MSNENLLTLKEASHLCGRKPRTLRAWIKTGRLKASRDGEKGNAPLVIEKGDLLATMRELGIIEPGLSGVTPKRNSWHTMTPQRDLPFQQDIESLKKYIYSLEKDKERLWDELRRERERADRLSETNEAIQRELRSVGSHGKGILGYITQRITQR